MRRATLHAVLLAACAAASSVDAADPARADALQDLYRQLADPANPDWRRVQSDILREWSLSGSPAMDLLLRRGREALEAGDTRAAIEHLTALTDHAPDFAEGWNARATAYFMAGRLGPSLADIRRVLQLNPNHFGALTGLGRIFEELGQDERAIAAYRAALAIHPHLEEVRQALERLERKSNGIDL